MSERLSLEQFLPYRLNRLSEQVGRDFARIYKDRHGLNRPEWRALATLALLGTATATEIGAHSAMHKTKVSRAVAELERRKWLTRSEDEADRRIERLRLTKAGLAVYGEIEPLARAFEADLLSRLGKADRLSLERGLAALEACFEQTG